MGNRTIIVLILTTLALSLGCKTAPKTTWTFPSEHSLLPVDSPSAELLYADLKAALVKLQRVHFALDSVELTPASRDALQDAKTGLADYPDIHIYVEGHADSRGASEYNISLAEKRATVVCDYLADLGMAAERLHIVSWGEEKPLVPGESETAHAQNRRVDFKLMRGRIELILQDGVTVASR